MTVVPPRFQTWQRWKTRNGQLVEIVAIGRYTLRVRFLHGARKRMITLNSSGMHSTLTDSGWDLVEHVEPEKPKAAKAAAGAR